MISSMSFSSATSPGSTGKYSCVSSFVRALVHGRPVTLVKEVPWEPFVERTVATWRLQRDLRTISIHAADLLSSLLVTDMIDVYTVHVDGIDVFPEQVSDGLTPCEIDRLLLVHHKSEDGTAMAFCFVEARQQSRDLLVQTLRVLINRAQGHEQRSSEGLTAAGLGAHERRSPRPTPRRRARR